MRAEEEEAEEEEQQRDFLSFLCGEGLVVMFEKEEEGLLVVLFERSEEVGGASLRCCFFGQ